MDYFTYGAASLSILFTLTALLLRTCDGLEHRRGKCIDEAGRRAVPRGFAIVGLGAITLVGAALPTFKDIFDYGIVAALGAVLVILGLGYMLGARFVAPVIKVRKRLRPIRRVPRLSDL